MSALTNTTVDISSDDTTRVLTVTINALYEELRVVGACLNAFYSLVLSEEDLAKLELSVVEGATNVVEHAFKEDGTRTMLITATLCSDRIRVVITDDGDSLSYETFEASRRGVAFDPTNVADLPENGLGLQIVNSFMDEVDYESNVAGVNRLSMTKYLL